MTSEEDFLNKYNRRNGVYILSDIRDEFESKYVEVRTKEGRIYSDEELLPLPFASLTNSHKNEWKMRAKSFSKFKNYLEPKKSELNILDLGCGNGWFSGQLSKSFNHNFYCVDVNLKELEQGKRVFFADNIKFIYADIFNSEFLNTFFHLITINAAIQYFPELKKLIQKLLTLMVEWGEIHIIDSPVYSDDEVENAKQRTADYFTSLGFSEMSKNYFHHTWKEFQEFNFEVFYNPQSVSNKIRKVFTKDSPFPWIRIKK